MGMAKGNINSETWETMISIYAKSPSWRAAQLSTIEIGHKTWVPQVWIFRPGTALPSIDGLLISDP